MPKRILLTGATGFLGSHLAEALLQKGADLLLTKRVGSDLWRCASFSDRVRWVDTDAADWGLAVRDFSPQVVINAAWGGVGSSGRENWSAQIQNIVFQQALLDICADLKIEKFIGIGSQAEYGHFDGIVSEEHPLAPTNAYGAAKVAALAMLRAFCENHGIAWYWFRLFSCFGEREDQCWLIPSTVKKMLTGRSMDLTPGEQKYAYLHVSDVVNIIVSASCLAGGGIFHISSCRARTLKELLGMVREYLNPGFILNFGALPYREGQSMHMQGDMAKTCSRIIAIREDEQDFKKKLYGTIEYYRSRYEDT